VAGHPGPPIDEETVYEGFAHDQYAAPTCTSPTSASRSSTTATSKGLAAWFRDAIHANGARHGVTESVW
jgi:hypothetical protein